jgi:hypothetical protein
MLLRLCCGAARGDGDERGRYGGAGVGYKKRLAAMKTRRVGAKSHRVVTDAYKGPERVGKRLDAGYTRENGK